jgi:hypothetical protein
MEEEGTAAKKEETAGAAEEEMTRALDEETVHENGPVSASPHSRKGMYCSMSTLNISSTDANV